MKQPSCPRCNYPMDGIQCGNCKYIVPMEKLKEITEKKKKKVVN